MAITTLDQYIGATKQRITWFKQAPVVALGGYATSSFGTAGQPGAGTLAGAATGSSTPIKPTSSTPGCPLISGGSVSYLSKVEFTNTVQSKFMLYDMLSKSGAYAYNSGTSTITNTLDISDRCPDYSGGGDTAYGVGNEIWIEIVTAMTSATAWQVQVTYYNQAGNLSTSIVSIADVAADLIIGMCFQIGLASGDTGVQSIKSVIVTTGGAAAGTFNVLILRPLWSGLIAIANGSEIHDFLRTGLPVVYTTSALYVLIVPDSTATGIPYMNIEIASG